VLPSAREADPAWQQGVGNLLLTIRAVDTVVRVAVVAVIIGIYLTRANDRNPSPSGPGHQTTDVRQDPPVVADAHRTVSQEEIPLRIDVDEDLPPLRPDHLQHHPNSILSGLGDPTRRDTPIPPKEFGSPATKRCGWEPFTSSLIVCHTGVL